MCVLVWWGQFQGDPPPTPPISTLVIIGAQRLVGKWKVRGAVLPLKYIALVLMQSGLEFNFSSRDTVDSYRI